MAFNVIRVMFLGEKVLWPERSCLAWRLASCSRALSVDNGGTMFLVVIGGDPGGSEGAEGGEGGGTLPDGELTVGGGDDLDLGTSWGEANDLILQSVGETLVHGGTTGEDEVLAELLSDVDVGGLDGLPGEGMDGLA